MPGLLLRVRGEMGCWQTGWEGCSGDCCLQEKKKRWFAELGAARDEEMGTQGEQRHVSKERRKLLNRRKCGRSQGWSRQWDAHDRWPVAGAARGSHEKSGSTPCPGLAL